MAKLPFPPPRHSICVICEGNEDYLYFKRLLELNVWNEVYSFFPINAKSASNIPARFQDAYQNDIYEVILIFCDTDKAPYREYDLIKKKINGFLGKLKATEKIIIYANPCTMQIILSHFGDVSLKNQGKKTNAEVIERYTGVKNYDAHKDQIETICKQIFKRTYPDMKQRVEIINYPDTTSCSTNFSLFLERFENNNLRWISEIKTALKSK